MNIHLDQIHFSHNKGSSLPKSACWVKVLILTLLSWLYEWCNTFYYPLNRYHFFSKTQWNSNLHYLNDDYTQSHWEKAQNITFSKAM